MTGLATGGVAATSQRTLLPTAFRCDQCLKASGYYSNLQHVLTSGGHLALQPMGTNEWNTCASGGTGLGFAQPGTRVV